MDLGGEIVVDGGIDVDVTPPLSGGTDEVDGSDQDVPVDGPPKSPEAEGGFVSVERDFFASEAGPELVIEP